MKEEDVTSNQLPYISQRNSKFNPVTQVTEESVLTVQGQTLGECKKVRDAIIKEEGSS